MTISNYLKQALLLFVVASLFACSRNTKDEISKESEQGISHKSAADSLPVNTEPQSKSPIEIIIVDLNNDKKLDTLTLKDKPEDPGSFTTIEVALANINKWTFSADDWDIVDEEFAQKYKNTVHSDKVHVTKHRNNTFILLFGFQYGSSRDNFSIIRIKENKAELIFDGDLENIIELKDLNKDEKLDLVAHNYTDRKDSLDALLQIPDGYYVYTLDSVMYFNLALSKEYNAANPYRE